MKQKTATKRKRRIDPDLSEFAQELFRRVNETGYQIMGVQDAEPTFSYSIGLLDKFGYEFIISGMAPGCCASIINEIVDTLGGASELPLDVPDARWTNLPVVFKPADGSNHTFLAFIYHNREDVPIVQMVLPDPGGLFPWQEGFDRAFMADKQELLFPTVQ